MKRAELSGAVRSTERRLRAETGRVSATLLRAEDDRPERSGPVVEDLERLLRRRGVLRRARARMLADVPAAVELLARRRLLREALMRAQAELLATEKTLAHLAQQLHGPP